MNGAAFHAFISLQNPSVHIARRFSKKDLDRLFLKDQWIMRKKFYWNTALILPILFTRWLKKLGLLKMSDVEMTNPVIDKVLYAVLSLERMIFKKLSFMPGLSLYCVAQKK